MSQILKEQITSKIRLDRMFAIACLKELGLMGVRVYKITKNKEHLKTLNNLSITIKKYEELEKNIYKKVA